MPFQHTAARRRLRFYIGTSEDVGKFQHTAARRRLLFGLFTTLQTILVSTHSRPKAAALPDFERPDYWWVSTHSRPKAAANDAAIVQATTTCFNTQPPEGGCMESPSLLDTLYGFNTQPPEGGCKLLVLPLMTKHKFQHTAARRRLLLL